MGGKKKETQPKYKNSLTNNKMLNYQVYVPGTVEKIAICLVLFAAGGVVGLIFYGGLFKNDGYTTMATRISDVFFVVVIGLIAVKFFYPVIIKGRLEKRNKKLRNEFKDMLSSLSASISSGSNVQKAFQDTYKDLLLQYSENDMVVQEVSEILTGVAQNINIETMIKDMGVRSGNDDILCFADVFETCIRKGGDLKSVIRKTYDAIVEKSAIEDEIDTKLTSNKLQHNIMSLMPIFVVAMLKYTNETFSENFATFTGVLVNTVAIGIFIASYKYGQKICDIEV